MGGGKGGGGGDSEQTIRYAGYIEKKHKAFLDEIVTRRTAAIDASPFANITPIAVDAAFLGVGFVLADFPSLYDMYGKFMAGLDIEVLYDQIFEDTVNGPQVGNLVAAEAALLDDDIVANVLPRFQTGMRDINSVVSSTFVIGAAMIEDARVKSIAKFGAELRYRLIPVATERWSRHLEWNKNVVMTYAEVVKLFIAAKMDSDNHNQEVVMKNTLWPFTVLDYERVAIAALQGATKSTTNAAGSSGVGRAISGALGGAAMGGMMAGASAGMVTGPFGMAIGAALGLAGSLF